jgi:hypothetical protein
MGIGIDGHKNHTTHFLLVHLTSFFIEETMAKSMLTTTTTIPSTNLY